METQEGIIPLRELSGRNLYSRQGDGFQLRVWAQMVEPYGDEDGRLRVKAVVPF